MSWQQPRTPRFVRCPQCKAPVAWTPESKWRPFCSERCKTIDLGAWASERYRVPTGETPGDVPDDAESDRTPDGASSDDR